MIISSTFPLGDLSHGMYGTYGHIAIVSAYGCDVYYNVLKYFHLKKHHMKILYSLHLVRTQEDLFDAVEFQQRYGKNPFALGNAYLTPLFQRVH